MSFANLIKSLGIRIQPTWNKKSGSGANESKVKVKGSAASVTSGRDSNIGGDFVAGDKHTQSTAERHPFVEITLGMRSSSQGEYTADFYLRSAGDSAATLQSFTLAGEPLPISKKTLIPTDPPYRIRQNITGLSIRNRKLDDPMARAIYKDLSGKFYATSAKIIQGSMAVGTFNIDEIKDNEFEKLDGTQ